MNLEELRNELDVVDARLEAAFIKRMEIVAKIADYKEANNIPVLDTNREAQVLEKHANNVDKKYEEYIKDFFTNVMRIAKNYQNARRNNK